ncbi:MAG: S8 family serine peptidase [Phycisphaerales bacterium]|nr:S8 family serine peptidase [Phycisphaerales bacterium]
MTNTRLRCRTVLRIMTLGAVAGLLALAGPASADEIAAGAGPDVVGGFASTHVLVRLRADASFDADTQRFAPDPAAASRAVARQTTLLPEVLGAWGVTTIEPVFTITPERALVATTHRLDRYYRIVVPRGTATPGFVAQLRLFDGLFEHVELDGVGGVAETVPDDPNFNVLYGLRNTGQTIGGQAGTPGADIHATEAWDYTTGDDDLVVAIVDAGTSPHVDLAGKLIAGWNTVSENQDTGDSCQSHGTHVAGTCAANGNNALGVAGVCWNVKVMPIRVLNGCTGTESELAEGITYAMNHGVDVVNMSLQYFDGSETLHDAVLAAHAAGLVLVAAAGNNPGFGVSYPGVWPETITVAATNNQDAHWVNSGAGDAVTVAAPGVNIYSLSGTTAYGYKTGTSMATPHVSGLACLLLSVDPSLTHDDIASVLMATADDVEGPGEDLLTGAGRVNALEAVLAVLPPTPGDLDGDGDVDPADLAALLSAWGACPGCPADLDGDGTVGPADLAVLLGNWG